MGKEIAYTHGRYQPLHSGHFKLFLKILDKHKALCIGITNPDLLSPPPYLHEEDEDTKKSVSKARLKENNPYTYEERKKMILDSFKEEGIDLSRIKVIRHYGHYDKKNWEEFMPKKENSIIILATKDPHHTSKINRYKEQGWETRVVPPIEGFSGKQFDKEWPKGDWEKLVPKGVVNFLEGKK